MDASTLRQLLTPFERNVLILLARYRGNVEDVAGELRGGVPVEDKRGELRIVGRTGGVQPESVIAAVESARAKIRRHLERGVSANGETAALDGRAPLTDDGGIDDLSHMNGDEEDTSGVFAGEREPERLGDRVDAPRMRSQDPQAARANAEAGVGRRRQDARRPGEAAFEVVTYVRDHGPVSSLRTRQACNIHATAMPDLVKKLVEREALVRTGEMDGRSPILAIGPKADDVKPPAAAKDAGAKAPAAPGRSPGASRSSPQRDQAGTDGPADLLGRYIDALLARIQNGGDCPDRVYAYIESQLTS